MKKVLAQNCSDFQNGVQTRVVKADFLKAVREAVAQSLIKAVKRGPSISRQSTGEGHCRLF